MNDMTERLLQIVSDWSGQYEGAYSIRENGRCAARKSTEFVTIEDHETGAGLKITVHSNAQNERVTIPACVTQSGLDDLVYNDFYIEPNASVTIVAGCGVHNDGSEEARHNGIHRFFIGKGAHVKYEEKHVGSGNSGAIRIIDPVTEAYLDADSTLEMDTVQLSGVDLSTRKMKAILADRAKLLVRERILTQNSQTATTEFTVDLNGEDCGADLISRSVAQGESKQHFLSCMNGNSRCTGHSECDAIIADRAMVSASPALTANHESAVLIHEAAIGKIAGEQILKLCTLGLTEEEAEAKIVAGFLK